MIRPKRAYRRNRYFARNELSRLCLGVLRTVEGELPSTAAVLSQDKVNLVRLPKLLAVAVR